MNQLHETLSLPSHQFLGSLLGKEISAGDCAVVRLTGLTPALTTGGLESFSLEFSGGPLGGQGIQTLDLPGHGPVEVFLVPIAPGRYEAAVNRSVP